MYLQQGDVLIKQANLLPLGAIPFDGNLIHKGDSHSHVINGDFVLYKHEKNTFIECNSACSLDHEEHKSILIPVGLYIKGIVQEYDHFLEESKDVID